jgi:UDP-N-acetylmuramyl tripeptide synthase
VELLDSRRLTGPNILSDGPAAIIDVAVAPAGVEALVDAWRGQVRRILDAVGWTEATLYERRVTGGVSLGFSAPADALYAATDVNDWAFDAARQVLAGERAPATDAAGRQLRDAIDRERNPRLLALADRAETRSLPVLMDDDALSIGYGRYSRTWPVEQLPDPDRVEWEALGEIPVGLVTGTNGKTTTVRLAAAMVRAAGRHVGLSSTDQIAVDDEILDHGDYSGPGGARAVLRDPRVDVAVLETARGGLLRRGTAMTRADAAVITNIAADHLDDYGVPDLEALADIKWLVTRPLGEQGVAILNAEDERLVERAVSFPGQIAWFALDGAAAERAEARAGAVCHWVVEDGWMVRRDQGERFRIAEIARVPVTLGGSARHNIANALAAGGLAHALGVPDSAIAEALIRTEDRANPGRCNLFRVGEAAVLVDFAHNPHGVSALAPVVEHYGQGRRVLMLGQAGDRGDETIRELARAAWALRPDWIVIKEMGHYARGREPGEVARILRDAFVGAGADPDRIRYVAEEPDAVRAAIELAGAGDLVVALVHEDVDTVVRLVGELEASGA